MIAIYPGSFDPVTYGHLDIIERASKVFDKIYVVVAINFSKQYLFDVDIRLKMVSECVSSFENVEVLITDKLIVQLAEELGVSVIIRGLRAVSDFEHELQLSTTNMFLNSEIETVFFMSSPNHTFLSSSQAREVAKFKGDLSSFVPKNVEEQLKKIYE